MTKILTLLCLLAALCFSACTFDPEAEGACSDDTCDSDATPEIGTDQRQAVDRGTEEATVAVWPEYSAPTDTAAFCGTTGLPCNGQVNNCCDTQCLWRPGTGTPGVYGCCYSWVYHTDTNRYTCNTSSTCASFPPGWNPGSDGTCGTNDPTCSPSGDNAGQNGLCGTGPHGENYDLDNIPQP